MTLAAFMLVAILSGIGLAVTVSVADHQRVVYQGALDSAVLAGASMAEGSDADRIARAQATFTANLNANGMSSGASTAFEATGVTPNFLILDTTVSGRANLNVKNFFAGIIGEKTLPATVTAAARVTGSHPVCVLSLDDTSPQGIEIYGTSQFTARNCAAQANSADGEGMKQYGNAVGRAKQFGVKGGYSGTGFSPRPITGVPVIDDPYASIPVPAAVPASISRRNSCTRPRYSNPERTAAEFE